MHPNSRYFGLNELHWAQSIYWSERTLKGTLNTSLQGTLKHSRKLDPRVT